MKKHFNLTTTEDNGKAITTTNTSTEYPEELVRMLTLAGQGMPQVAPAPVADDCGCGGSPCGCGEAVEEEMETEYQATPANDELSLDDYSKKTANSIPRQKKRLKPSAGDNPLEYSMDEDDIYEALMADFDLNEDDSYRDRDNFVTAYISAAEELVDDEEFEDGHVDWSSEAVAEMERDAENFFAKAEDLLAQTGVEDPRQHGYDFWLTRNGHGAGFWARGYGDIGDKLTAFAEKFGEANVYKGDDGKAHIG